MTAIRSAATMAEIRVRMGLLRARRSATRAPFYLEPVAPRGGGQRRGGPAARVPGQRHAVGTLAAGGGLRSPGGPSERRHAPWVGPVGPGWIETEFPSAPRFCLS